MVGNGYYEQMFDDKRVKKCLVAALGLLSLFLLAKTVAEFQSLRYIGSSLQAQSVLSVSGKGEVVGVPDIATFSFAVSEESLVVKEAQDEAARKMSEILAYLRKSGVAERDIKTTGYSIYPRYEYATPSAGALYPYPQGKQKLAAYVVSQNISVKVRNLGDAGKLLGGIGELGATDVSGLSFDFDRRETLTKEAREKAITEARKEATVLAKALGVHLVRILSYSEGGSYPIYMTKEMSASVSGGRGGIAPEIPVGEDKILSQVTLTYEIR